VPVKRAWARAQRGKLRTKLLPPLGWPKKRCRRAEARRKIELAPSFCRGEGCGPACLVDYQHLIKLTHRDCLGPCNPKSVGRIGLEGGYRSLPKAVS